MSVRLIVDSTADIPAQLKESFTVVPLTVRFGDEEYLDGVTIHHREFYEKLIESDVLPTTSQVPPDDFAQIFEKVVSGGDEAVVLTISSELSGTYQSACIAAMDYPGRIFVVDSRSVAIGSAILAEYALQLREQGMSAEALAAELTKARDRVQIVALLDTLEYLKKGGRISKTAAIAGSMLAIKPVLGVKDGTGTIQVLGKARGSKQGQNLLVKQIGEAGGVDFDMPLLLGYSGLSDALLQKYMEDSAPLWQDHRESLPYTCVGSVIGTHAGPGAVAVAFFARQNH